MQYASKFRVMFAFKSCSGDLHNVELFSELIRPMQYWPKVFQESSLEYYSTTSLPMNNTSMQGRIFCLHSSDIYCRVIQPIIH